MRLIEPTYTMRIYNQTDSNSELDYFQFNSTVPTEDHTWGAIKSFYKD